MIYEIDVKTALNKIQSTFLPYSWDLNLYRGCSHHCQYCYAQYSHRYLDDPNFFGDIYVKKNIAELLDRQLSRRSWKRAVINLGGVTDNYQSLEEKYQLMPSVLDVLIKHQNPVVISTKSDLLLRDLALWKKLAAVAPVSIAASLTIMNESLRQRLEPGAKSAESRLAMLKKVKEETRAVAGILMMPILPYLNDSDENFNALFRAAKKSRVDFVLPGVLNLRSQTRTHFLTWLSQEFPQLYPKYRALYRTSYVVPEYKNSMYPRLRRIQEYYGIPNYVEIDPKSVVSKSTKEQLKLF